MSDVETIAGVQRVPAGQHHDPDAGSLFACRGNLVVHNLAAGGEREPQVTVGDASDMDGHLGAPQHFAQVAGVCWIGQRCLGFGDGLFDADHVAVANVAITFEDLDLVETDVPDLGDEPA
jgi:hypothetical protein